MDLNRHFPFGRSEPGDWARVEKYPYSAVAPTTTATVEKTLKLPRYRAVYDQHQEGASPVVFGLAWYVDFDKPVKKGAEYWIGEGDLTLRRGAHAVCIFRAPDRLQAVGIVKNRRTRYSLVWMPDAVVDRMLREHGKAALVTDRP